MIRELKFIVFEHKGKRCFYIGRLLEQLFSKTFSVDKKYGRKIACFNICDENDILKCGLCFEGEKRLVKISKGYDHRFLLFDKVPGLYGGVGYRVESSGMIRLISDVDSGTEGDVCEGKYGKEYRFGFDVNPGYYYVFDMMGGVVLIPENSKNFIFLTYSSARLKFDVDSIFHLISEKINDNGNYVDCVTFLYDEAELGWFGFKKTNIDSNCIKVESRD